VVESSDASAVSGRVSDLSRRAGRLFGGIGRQVSSAVAATESIPDDRDATRERYRDAVSDGPFTDQLVTTLAWLFPDGLDPDSSERVRFVTDPTRPLTASGIRRILGMVDQSKVPSAFGVRFGADDLERFTIDGPSGAPITMLLDMADASVSAQIAETGRYEHHVSAVLDQHLGSGSVFVDVGANIGYHSLRAAQSVGPTGSVIAVEASPENSRLLIASAMLNEFDNLAVLPVALADHIGHRSFGAHIGSNAGMVAAAPTPQAHLEQLMSSSTSVVPTIPLDALGLDRVDVIKIDVEGAEAAVIAGARATIGNHRPVIITEFSAEMTARVAGLEPVEHLSAIIEMGYRLSVIDRSGGGLVDFGGAAELLADWGDPLRIEDLVFRPI